MAQAADPSGSRTVGVLTKLDLMDPGTDCSEILLNQVIPLRRGYVAIVNRGQKDIDRDLSIRDGFRKEEAFFRNHPVYSRDRTLLQKCGTLRLAKALNNMLMHHIRDCLPDLKHRITHMSNDVQQELEALGSPTHNTSRSTRGAALLSLLSKFANNFSAILDGKGSAQESGSRAGARGPNARHFDTELYGGARISYIFTQVFARSLSGVGAFDGLSDDEIRTTICNAHGTRSALFVPEQSFDILVRRQVARLEEPGVCCVDLIYEELQRIAAQSEPHELTRFPVLRDRMVEVVLQLLRRCVGPTQLMVANLIKIELAYVNTSHPDFIGGSKAVASLMGKLGKENNGDRNTKSSSSVAGVFGGIPETIASATPQSSTSLKKNGNSGFQDAVQDEDDDDDDDDDCNVVDDSPAPYVSNTRRSKGGAAQQQSGQGGIMNMLFNNNNNGTSGINGGKKKSSKSGGGGSGKNNNNNRRSSFEPPSIVNLPQVSDHMKPTDVPPSDKERIEMEIIKSLVESYFDIVRKNFTDMVPKTIMYFLVNHVRDSLQNELVSELYREAEVGTLLQEAEDIASRRQTCLEMKDLLSKALEIVNEVRDFNSFK
jgi:dynamin 1-like protein